MSEKTKETKETKEETKQLNPSIDKSNYLIQVMANGQVIKEVIALNATLNIVAIGERSLAADIK